MAEEGKGYLGVIILCPFYCSWILAKDQLVKVFKVCCTETNISNLFEYMFFTEPTTSFPTFSLLFLSKSHNLKGIGFNRGQRERERGQEEKEKTKN